MNPRLFASDTIFSIPLEVGSSRFRVVDIVDTFLDIFTDCKRSFLYESSETSNGIHRYIIVLVHFLSLLRSTFYALCTTFSSHLTTTASVGLNPESLGRLVVTRSEEHTSELQSQSNLVCRL